LKTSRKKTALFILALILLLALIITMWIALRVWANYYIENYIKRHLDNGTFISLKSSNTFRHYCFFTPVRLPHGQAVEKPISDARMKTKETCL
jgi:hypothetical protein